VYVRELHVSYRRRRIRGSTPSPEQLNTPEETAVAFARLLRDEPVEVCGLFCLSTKQQVLAYHELSRGTLDASMVHPRDVFKIALLANARSVILGHNHPSGNPTPSPEDFALTRRLVGAAEIIGIDLLDHVVVGHDGGYWSFREHGHLSTAKT
jgi:DNA repair protein RadC